MSDRHILKTLSVNDFIETRTFIAKKLRESAPRSQANFDHAAEHLMKLGVIDIEAVLALVNPPEPDEDESYPHPDEL